MGSFGWIGRRKEAKNSSFIRQVLRRKLVKKHWSVVSLKFQRNGKMSYSFPLMQIQHILYCCEQHTRSNCFKLQHCVFMYICAILYLKNELLWISTIQFEIKVTIVYFEDFKSFVFIFVPCFYIFGAVYLYIYM